MKGEKKIDLNIKTTMKILPRSYMTPSIRKLRKKVKKVKTRHKILFIVDRALCHIENLRTVNSGKS